MSYIESSLSQGERLIRRFEIHWAAYVIPAFICLTVVGAPFALATIIGLRFTEFGLTNRRVICKRGIIARHTEEMPLRSVEAITLHQSIFERLLGAGTVRLTGRGISDVLLTGIEAPLDVKKAIETARHEAGA